MLPNVQPLKLSSNFNSVRMEIEGEQLKHFTIIIIKAWL